MLRGLLIAAVVLLALMGALFGAGAFDRFLFEDQLAREQTASVARQGIQDRMKERYGDELRLFTVGRQLDEERWDFRGQLVQGAEAKPFYGVARRECGPTESDIAECWELTSLLIDGDEVIAVAAPAASGGLGASAALSTAGGATRGAEASGAANGSGIDASPATSDTLPTTDTGVQDPTGSTQQPEDAAAATAPETDAAPAPPAEPLTTTHVISGTEVNMRDGPGRNYNALFVAYRGQELMMLEDQGEWARFKLVGGDHEGEEAWIFTPLTRPAS